MNHRTREQDLDLVVGRVVALGAALRACEANADHRLAADQSLARTGFNYASPPS